LGKGKGKRRNEAPSPKGKKKKKKRKKKKGGILLVHGIVPIRVRGGIHKRKGEEGGEGPDLSAKK